MMNQHNRRQFIRTSVLGVSAAGLLPSTAPAAPIPTVPGSTFEPICRTLGRTGLKVPVIGMGTGDTNNPRLIEAALDKGIRFFASSRYYGNGKNEEMLGGVFKNRPRDSFIIATSAMPEGIDHRNGIFTTSNIEQFRKDVEDSLRLLNVNELDILFLPFVAKRESVLYEPYLRMMENLKKEGKTKFVGIASHSFEHEALRAAADTGIYDVAMLACNFRQKTQQELAEAIEYATGKGMGIIAMKTQAGGFFDKERKEAINGKAALKWVLSNPNVHTTVPGITTFEELDTDIALLQEISLTDEERKDLRLAGYSEGTYCLQCKQCLPQCPHGVDIPTHMRSYMYAYSYKNREHAYDTLHMACDTLHACNRCTVCSIVCAQGFDVQKKILDISRLRDVPKEFLS